MKKDGGGIKGGYGYVVFSKILSKAAPKACQSVQDASGLIKYALG